MNIMNYYELEQFWVRQSQKFMKGPEVNNRIHIQLP